LVCAFGDVASLLTWEVSSVISARACSSTLSLQYPERSVRGGGRLFVDEVQICCEAAEMSDCLIEIAVDLNKTLAATTAERYLLLI
jgi:hypothetical protein